MKRVFKEVGSLDRKCYEKYGLTEDILMEHAAMGLYDAIPKEAKRVLIVSGVGNNGADGIVLSRLLFKEKDVELYLPMGVKSAMAKLQLERVKKLGVQLIDEIGSDYDVVVDAIFGSGLKRELSSELVELIEKLNSIRAYKIACDIPTGINEEGRLNPTAFIADVTVTMGALKEALFLDEAKDFVGEIRVQDLGVSREMYEEESSTYLLEESDLKLPNRNQKDTNKATFGHLSVVAGRKVGAAVLTAQSAFALGSGLVTIVENENYQIPYEIMSSCQLPEKTTAIAIGMGLGNIYDDEYLERFLSVDIPHIIDADLFYRSIIKEILDSKKDIVLTPHPKEFASLLKICEIADIDVAEVQKRRFYYAREFSKKYPNVVLLLKGANVLISHDKELYINPIGTNVLSKGGSGDVLAGFIGGFLAQGYSPLHSTIQGSLVHTITAKRFSKNSYALTPQDLIEGAKSL